MNSSQRLALARLFAGPTCTRMSVYLNMPATGVGGLGLKETAQDYFLARQALGITGWPNEAQAGAMIQRSEEPSDE